MEATKTRTILYIEDDAASRVLVERTLRHAGYRVLLAEDGLSGIDLARREMPDLILTDINLPDLSGRELTTMLRGDARFKSVPIVALTAQAYDEHRHLAMAAGVTGYLTKPLDVEALPNQVAHYLQGARDEIDPATLADAQTRYTREVVARLEERIRQLEEVNAELRRLDKMKDTFIQLTAHELRTPLTLIYGYARLIESSPDMKAALQKDEMARQTFDGMVDSIQRMQGVINEIVTMSRIMTDQISLKIGPVNLGAVAEKALLSYQQALRDRRLKARFNRTEWPTTMQGDGELLALAMSNLVSNAIKYTPDGGEITLAARHDRTQVRFSVRDTGIGIHRDEQQTIFERFHTAGDTRLHSTSKTAFRGGGLGLGLAVTRGIIAAHDGRIWVESPGRDVEKCPGSEFIVVMPLVPLQARQTVS